MTENQKSLVTWSIVLVLAVVTALVFVFTVPDLSAVERIIYQDNAVSTATMTHATTASAGAVVTAATAQQPLKSTTQKGKQTEAISTNKTQTAPAAPSFPLNINTATKEELMSVPGIGEVYAERIIAYRIERGGFSSLEELLNIKGIGEKRLESFSPYFTLGE